jgi:uncharacterized protein
MDFLHFKRDIEPRLKFITGLPVLVLVGARRVGKTTLLRTWYSKLEQTPRAWLDGDNPAHLMIWERLRTGQDAESWFSTLTGSSPRNEIVLFLDEAQMFPDSSRLVKSMVDGVPALRVVMSGSSALKLKEPLRERVKPVLPGDLSSESLAGRKQLLELYPLNLRERLQDPRLTVRTDHIRAFSATGTLGDMLVWGGFPALTNLKDSQEKTSYLVEVVDSVLYRDLMGEVRQKDITLFKRLLVALARAIGSKVNTSKLGTALELSRPTITRYLDLLQEASVIALLPGIDGQGIVPKAQAKVYFLDNGILSMLLADDRVLEVRKPEDQSMLLENFVVGELIKRYAYSGDKLTQLGYLWHPKGETDIVAFRNGGIQQAWEVKLTDSQGGSRITREALGGAPLDVVNLGNISEFLMDDWGSKTLN